MNISKPVPRTQKTFTKYIEGRAFGDVMDSGDPVILNLIKLHAEDPEMAFYVYSATTFLEKHNWLSAIKEGCKLIYEAGVIEAEDKEIKEFVYDIYYKLINVDSELRYWATKLPATLQKRCKYPSHSWSVLPQITTNGQKMSLGVFLIFLAFETIDKETITTSKLIYMKEFGKIFFEKFIPWYQTMRGKQ